MAAPRACFVLAMSGLVAVSCTGGVSDSAEGEGSDAVASTVTDPTEQRDEAPAVTEPDEAPSVVVPAGPLYLPSTIPDGWSIRSVTMFPDDVDDTDGAVSRQRFIVHPTEGGYEGGGITLDVVEYVSSEAAEIATAAGQFGFDATTVAVGDFGEAIVEDQFEEVGLAALSVSQGTTGIVLLGQKPVADMIAVADGLRIETNGEGASNVGLDLAGWQLADTGSASGSYEIEVRGPTDSIAITVSPGQSSASLYALGNDLEQVLDGEIGEGYLAIQRNEAEGLEFAQIVWWVPNVRLTGYPASDPAFVAEVLDSFSEVDEATFIDRTAAASFVTLEPDAAPQGEPPVDSEGAPARPFDDARLDVLTDFVEDFVGRPFDDRPSVSLIDRERLTGQVPPGTFVSESQWDLYRALGLISPDADRLVAESVRIEQVRGVCCPVQVVEQPDPDFNEVVIVHELTHGLDTELDASGVPSGEPTDPRVALVEGNAHRVAFAYRDLLAAAGAELPEAPAVFADVDDPRLPGVIRELLEFPYDEGRLFAIALAELDGEQAIVDAFANPPTTSEQILDVDTYLAGETAVRVPPPASPDGSELISTGSIGAFSLRLLLGLSLDSEAATALALTWSGDQYGLFGDPDAPCVAATILVDDEAAADDLVEALGADAGHALTNEVARDGTAVSLSRCPA